MTAVEIPKAENVVQAMAAVMEEVRAVKKDGQFNGGGVRYNFRGIDGVVNAVGPALRKFGVVVVPASTTVEYRDVTTSGGKPSRESTVNVVYKVYGPGGANDFITINVPGEALDSSDKGTAKAMSVAFRIALLQAFSLPTEDVDPDDVREERGKPTKVDSERVPADVVQVNGALSGLRAEVARRGRLVGLSTDDLDAGFRSSYKKSIAGANEKQLNDFLKTIPEPAESA